MNVNKIRKDTGTRGGKVATEMPRALPQDGLLGG